MIKLGIWSAAVIMLCLICVLYHKSPYAQFEPVVTVALIILISFILFTALGLLGYFTDNSFSGEIVDIKVDVRYHKESAFDRHITTRTYVGMTVECDDGKAIYFEQMLPAHLGNKIPYQVGDRIYHIKGAKNTCRFPRNDTVKEYEPISVICPICGALHPLGTKTCSFCENDLPYDPNRR